MFLRLWYAGNKKVGLFNMKGSGRGLQYKKKTTSDQILLIILLDNLQQNDKPRSSCDNPE